MTELSARQKNILSVLVPEYISGAAPIGSEFLVHNYSFGVGPATIRNELQALTELGYVEQPHTSAGRIPTDMGYRFYIDMIIREERPVSKISKRQRAILKLAADIGEEENFELNILKNLSEFSENLAFSIGRGAHSFNYEGLRKVFTQPEFQNRQIADNFLEMLEYAQDRIDEVLSFVETQNQRVFVGKELTIFPYHHFGLVIAPLPQKRGKKTWISILGPKRMPYKEYLELMNLLEENLN